MSNILEEYLVRIGAEVDKDAFAGAAQASASYPVCSGSWVLSLNMAVFL